MSAFIRSVLALVVTFAVAAAFPASASAQSTSPPLKPKPNPYASPLDTIMSTRLWTDVPQMQDFVKSTSPDPQKLEYAPLIGKDPERPKPRDAAGIAALQAELEGGAAANDARAKGLHPRKPTAKGTAKKATKTKQASAKVPAVSGN